MTRTLGIHWIATTFGTWLHGDARGSWKNGKLIGSDPFLEETIRERLTADSIVLSEVEMALTATIFGQAVEEKRWRVYAATVHPTHTHVVFGTLADPIETVIATLKYRSAKAVWKLRRTMMHEVGRSMWTEGQFPVFIEDERHLLNAIQYVREHNTRIGREADPYSWIRPI